MLRWRGCTLENRIACIAEKAMKINLRLYKNKKLIRQYTKDKLTSKIFNIIKAKVFDKAYVKVYYGIKENNLGKKIMFYNDGIYEDKPSLIKAIKIFWRET